jgi:hypothetical protein
MNEGQLLSQQVQYYRERAAEYDEWFLRQGRSDQGPEHRAEWFREVALIEAALRETVPEGDVLERGRLGSDNVNSSSTVCLNRHRRPATTIRSTNLASLGADSTMGGNFRS